MLHIIRRNSDDIEDKAKLIFHVDDYDEDGDHGIVDGEDGDHGVVDGEDVATVWMVVGKLH